MAVYAKKRKPFIIRFFIVIFWIVLVLALILGAVWCYLYFTKKVNYISAINQISTLSVQVEESELITNSPTSNDLTNIKTKMQTSSLSTNGIEITDAEYCAYVNDQIAQDNININFCGIEKNAKDIGLDVKQVVFNSSSQNSDVLVEVNITFKFNTAFVKEKLSTFPLSLISSTIPETIYIAANGELLSTANGQYSYTIKPTELKLNTLSSNDTANLLNFVNIFTNFGDAETLNMQILQLFCDKLIGTNQNASIYQQFSVKVEDGYETTYSFPRNNIFKINVSIAQYEIKVIQILGQQQNADFGTISGAGTDFLYGNSTTLSVTENVGYQFSGWYSWYNGNLELLSKEKTWAIDNIIADMLFYAKFEYIEKQITYINEKGCDNNNLTSYTVANGIITLQELHLTGYNFLGWFKDNTTEVTEIDSSSMMDYYLYAHWETKKYKIKYELNGGTPALSNPTEYTIETETFTVNNPVKLDQSLNEIEFVGWTGGKIDGITKTVTITKGSFGDLKFYAHYANDAQTYTVNLVVDGKEVTNFSAVGGLQLSDDAIDEHIIQFAMAGYAVNNWYTDSAQKTLYTEPILTTDLTLYGSWTYFMDNFLFIPYIDKFDSANENNSTMEFESDDELVAWIDYVVFYNVTRTGDGAAGKPKFYFANKTISMDDISNALATWQEQVNYQTVYLPIVSVLYKIGLKNYGSFYIDSGDADYYDINGMATQKASSTSMKKNQYNNALTFQNVETRSADTFPIDNVTKTVSNISNTEQLVRVLEQGYKPVCVESSSADTVYKKAKSVLKEICNDDMNDFQKLQAIYEWLTLNVQYDHNVITLELPTNDTRLYASWFAEGVFNNGLAVCEGYAKSALIMARIEGIPAVVVTDYYDEMLTESHAWNKVQVGGDWYQFDATHGDYIIGNNEATTYTKFLFTTGDRVATCYTDLICNTSYNFYENVQYTYNDSQFNLIIDSQDELETLLNYVKTYSGSGTCSIEFYYSSSSISSILTNAIKGIGAENWTCSIYNPKTNVYLIIIDK